MRKTILLLISFAVFLSVAANDSAFRASGSMFRPYTQTKIEVLKEVLTIRLADDGRTYVDVDYTFFNHGERETFLMGFEAPIPYNSDFDETQLNGGSPYIHDFTVRLNGEAMRVKTGVVKYDSEEDLHNKPLAIIREELKNDGEDIYIYRKDSARYFDGVGQDGEEVETFGVEYVYYFDAVFEKGENRVRHTYNYEHGNNVCGIFDIVYDLQPAARWKGGRIGDFTLVVECPNTAKHFFIEGDFCRYAPKCDGDAKYRRRKKYGKDDGMSFEVSMRESRLVWQIRDYEIKGMLYINSADMCELDENEIYYDRSKNFAERLKYTSALKNSRIVRNLPYASRGYVFKSKELKDYFSQVWWYMPKADCAPKMEDFYEWERDLIEGKGDNGVSK